MDAAGFDTLARSLQRHIARRTALGVLGGGLAALLTRVGPGDASARKKQKHKKKPKLNEFGCVNIGGKCRGKNGLCCSGICQGKKRKKKARRTRASASPTTAVAASLGRTPAMPLMSRVMVVLDFPVSASGRPARLDFAAARPTAGTAERTVTAKRQMGRGSLRRLPGLRPVLRRHHGLCCRRSSLNAGCQHCTGDDKHVLSRGHRRIDTHRRRHGS